MTHIPKLTLIIIGVAIAVAGFFYFLNSNPNEIPIEVTEIPEGFTRYDYGPSEKNYFLLSISEEDIVAKKTKLVIVTHGGGFLGGGPEDEVTEGGIGTYFLEQGYSVASIGYQLCPEVKWPTPVEDIGRGVQAVFDLAIEEGVEIDDVTYSGFSAGPGAGALLLYSDKYPSMPPIDRFVSFGGTFSYEAVTQVAKETILECEDTAESAIVYPDIIKKSKTPALLIEGEGDEFDAYPETERSHPEFLADLLRKSGIHAETFWAREESLLKLNHPLKTECIHGCGVDLLMLGDEEIRSAVDAFMKK
jgi:acetyl esterase/lipase